MRGIFKFDISVRAVRNHRFASTTTSTYIRNFEMAFSKMWRFGTFRRRFDGRRSGSNFRLAPLQNFIGTPRGIFRSRHIFRSLHIFRARHLLNTRKLLMPGSCMSSFSEILSLVSILGKNLMNFVPHFWTGPKVSLVSCALLLLVRFWQSIT